MKAFILGLIAGFATAGAVGAAGLPPDFELPFRQVHLDFHTSEKIPGVASAFAAEEFAATLDRARVNSVTCFGRCHHGWIYYDTKLFPERRFPGLTRNLLKEQIEACHKRGIRAPVYLTIQWDHYTSSRHPEWVMRNEKGGMVGHSSDPAQSGFYARLCLNTPYVDFLHRHIDELFDCVPVDGLFLDIVAAQPCYCDTCRKGMTEGGLNPALVADARTYAADVMRKFCEATSRRIRARDPRCTIFYNGGHIGPGLRPSMDAFSHFEMESLPSGGWGYMHFPVSARYVRTLGKPGLGVTGKFHTSWGDFHSFKNLAALQFECFQMLALGAACSIGDQLHPSGRLDEATYKLIGAVYREVEAKEPWCRGATALSDIAIVSPEEITGERVPEAASGAVRMLQEGRHQFDVVDFQSDFSPYRVLILPDVITVDDALAAKLDAYLAQGGSILASFESGLDRAKAEFRLPQLGVRKTGEGPLTPDGAPTRGRTFSRNNFVDYIIPGPALGASLEPTEHVMYLRGLPVEAATGADVLAPAVRSYFDRMGEAFCSHRQTPSSGEVAGPAVVRNGRCVYFSHPVFTQYHRSSPRWCRVLVLDALALLLPDPLVRVEAPTTAVASLNAQTARNRWVLHLLHYIPERRGQAFDVIEDVIPLHDVRVSVRSDTAPAKVSAVPQGVDLPFRHAQDRVEFTLPRLDGHQMVELQY